MRISYGWADRKGPWAYFFAERNTLILKFAAIGLGTKQVIVN